MEEKKIITICQFGGEFLTNVDGTLSYHGGEAHAIDIDHQTRFDDFKAEVSELLNCSPDLVSVKYFLPRNRRTLITISNDKDLKRMISFNGDQVDIFITAGEIVAHNHSNMPASRSSRTTLSEAVVLVDPTPLDSRNDNLVETEADNDVDIQNDNIVDTPIDIPVDSAPPVHSLTSADSKNQKFPSSWCNAITGVKQRFHSAQEFREALHKYAIAHRFAYKFMKNDRVRVTAKCKTESCPWRIHASRLLSTELFCIKTMNPTHTCEGGVVTSGSHATTNWAAGIVIEKLKESPNYKPKDIANDIKREYGIELNYYQAWRGKEIAREQLRGSYREAYTQLPFLCEKIMELNPGSFATFTTKDDSSFHCLFVSFYASIHGFQQGCRPLLFLDSLPLNSKYEDTLLVATAADGDDGVFPVAFAVVDDETVDNWRWFLTELKSAVSISQSVTFIADTEKGLRESIPEVFENCYHGYCLRYLSEKFRKDLQTHFSKEVKCMMVADFFASAYALKFEEFQRSTESIKEISLEAFSWVMNSKPEHWANTSFEGARYNHMTSNFGESFYNWVSEGYELPITYLVHTMQGKIMELIDTRSLESVQWLTRLTPSMEEKLQNEISKAHSLELEVSFSPDCDTIFEVCGESLERVDIDQWICSCRGWQITGLPCYHAIAVFDCIDRCPYDYCSRYFTAESYRLTYSESIKPIPNDYKSMQKESSQQMVTVTPPPPRRTLGRPRIRKASQSVDNSKRKRSKCKGVENNKLTFKEDHKGSFAL